MADIPFPMTWGTIKGTFGALNADSADAGPVPDLETVQGTVTITPRIPLVKIYDPQDPMIAIAKVISCRIVEGKLIGPDGMAEVRVVASDSPGVEPTPLQYDIRMTITGATQQPAPITIDVPTGGVVDLALVVPAIPAVPVVTVVSEESKIEAIRAALEAKSAAQDAINAEIAAEAARIDAVNAKNTASAAAETAVGARDGALSSASDAFGSMINAQNAAGAAITAQGVSESASLSAVNSANSANQSATRAEQARDEAVEAAEQAAGGGLSDQGVADLVTNPQSATNSAISSIFSKKSVFFIDIRDVGASVDNSDNTAAVQTALNMSPGIPVLIPRGYFTCASALNMPSETAIQLQAGAVLRSTQTSGSFLNADGVEFPPTSISGTVSPGMTTITSVNHGMVAGDYFKLSSGKIYDASSTGSSIGEILRVLSVDGDVITTETPVVGGPYTFADGRSLVKFIPAKNIEITGPGVIEGNKVAQANQIGVRMRFAVDIRIENVNFKFFDQRHTVFRDCAEGIIDKCTFDWAVHTSQAYGVSVVDATQDFNITNCTFHNVRHSLSTNNSAANLGRGLPRRVRFAFNNINWSSTALGGSMGGGDAIDTHTAAEDIWIENNTVMGSSGQGINFECTSGRVVDNYVYGSVSNGISVHNESDTNGRIVVRGNVVRNPGGHGIVVNSASRGASSFYDYAQITGNIVEGVTGTSNAYQIGNTTSTVDRNVIFTGNSAVNCSGAYIFLIRGMSGMIYGDDNTFTNSTGAIVIQDSGSDQRYGTGTISGTTLTISLQYDTMGILPIGTVPYPANTLSTITPGRRGQRITLRKHSVASYTITINNSGNITLASGTTYSLVDNAYITFLYNGQRWIEEGRSF